MSNKTIATHHARLRPSILQHEIPHSRMLVRPYERSQTPNHAEIRGVLWKLPQVEGPVSFKISEIFVGKELDVWKKRGMEETMDDEVISSFIFYCSGVNFEYTF